jgi:hypothetical protein
VSVLCFEVESHPPGLEVNKSFCHIEEIFRKESDASKLDNNLPSKLWLSEYDSPNRISLYFHEPTVLSTITISV